jgi:hypothetical protein
MFLAASRGPSRAAGEHRRRRAAEQHEPTRPLNNTDEHITDEHRSLVIFSIAEFHVSPHFACATRNVQLGFLG